MIKNLLALVLALNAFLVYADDDVVDCMLRIKIYIQILELRKENKYTEMVIISTLGRGLLRRGVTENETADIMREAISVYEDTQITSQLIYKKYLLKCPGILV